MLLGTNDGVTWKTVQEGATNYWALVVEVGQVTALKRRRAALSSRPVALERLVEELRG